MTDLSTIRMRIERGDRSRFYLDYYGSHWVELTSVSIIPWKSHFRISPREAMELCDLVARRAAMLPERAPASVNRYRGYRGGFGMFLAGWIGNEIAIIGGADTAKAPQRTAGIADRAHALLSKARTYFDRQQPKPRGTVQGSAGAKRAKRPAGHDPLLARWS